MSAFQDPAEVHEVVGATFETASTAPLVGPFDGSRSKDADHDDLLLG